MYCCILKSRIFQPKNSKPRNLASVINFNIRPFIEPPPNRCREISAQENNFFSLHYNTTATTSINIMSSGKSFTELAAEISAHSQTLSNYLQKHNERQPTLCACAAPALPIAKSDENIQATRRK